MPKQRKTWNKDQIRRLRVERLQMDTDEFADFIDASPWTVKWWEGGRGDPNGPTRRLFDFIEQDLDRQPALLV